MQQVPSPVSCPLCKTDNIQVPPLSYSQAPWRLKQCSNCGLVYLENPPSYQELETSYAWEKTFDVESQRRSRKHPLLHSLGRLPKQAIKALTKRDKLRDLAVRYLQPGPILDVGCAGGHALAALPESYIPYGIEISQELSQIASKRFTARGGDVIQGDALTGLSQASQGKFSGVIMTSYLEHEVHPREALLLALKVLRTDGKLIIKVPNYGSWNRYLRGEQWCGFRFPDHVNYFTPRLLVKLLNETGYETLQFNLSDHLPTSDNMWIVAAPQKQ